jgi:aryl-alcohol dehydrogenase-like predicted oxidoreductase
MRTTALGPIANVSRITLGGGGLGAIWGPTTAEEAVATVHAAIDGGVTLIDTAPSYRDCEAVIGQAFDGALPTHVRITTKCQLGAVPPAEVATRLEASLTASLAAMKLPRADILFLHSNICEDDYVYARGQSRRDRFATPWSLYVGEVVPALEALKASGRIGAWGITGIGVPATILEALDHAPAPDVVQAITNLLDSAGGIRGFSEPERPREITAAAAGRGIGVMGIRAVQAGALTAAIDRELPPENRDAQDYQRAAPFRALCADLGVDPAVLAHRYALTLEGVDTVVIGVKNRAELADCLDAERQGPLPPDLLRRIDALGLRGAE